MDVAKINMDGKNEKRARRFRALSADKASELKITLR
jgi:hypothetical protein